MTIASGAGLSCAENHTRNRLSNQNTAGTGRAQGSFRSISRSGTLSGNGAISWGGVPNTVARSAAESARPVAGPGAGGAGIGVGGGAIGVGSGADIGRLSAIAQVQTNSAASAAGAKRTFIERFIAD